MSDPMTNSSRPIKCVNLLDPRLEALEPAQRDLLWAIPKAPEGQNFVQQQANSYSTAGITFNFNTQSENVLIDRRRLGGVVLFLLTAGSTAAPSFNLHSWELPRLASAS